MKCYRCGAELTKHNFCTSCKSDVRQYKQIMYASNRMYNSGLEKAGVRDLSGAVRDLHQCLKLNKEHVDAHNLLGLVYFEMGEVAQALCEWTLSTNLQQENNVANQYISELQKSPNDLNDLDQAIRKYNLALAYCEEGNDDLAMIQLKRVQSLNPKFLKASLLLALIYMHHNEYDKASALLKKVLKADRSNITAQRYLNEISEILRKGSEKKRKKEETVRYERDNEVIIQPANVKEPKSGSGLITGLVIGLVLGAAVIFFLIMPSRLQSARSDYEETLRLNSETMDAQNVTISELESSLETLQEQYDTLSEQYAEYFGGTDSESVADSLIMAASAYLTNPADYETFYSYFAVCLAQDAALAESESSISALYLQLKELVASDARDYFYNMGYSTYESGDYETAYTSLSAAVLYDDTYADAWYYLGLCCSELGSTDEAKEAYEKVIELVPGTNTATLAQSYLDALE
ncbi:MAG: tetratricopeptide repeat protein [Lachnospiraceae bacterium]|nr:tetratricopeptide repeat protein [Lachnospiraceae bacterium]